MKIIAGTISSSKTQKLIELLESVGGDVFDIMDDIFIEDEEYNDIKNDMDLDDAINYIIDNYEDMGMTYDDVVRAFKSSVKTEAVSDKAKLSKTEKKVAKKLATLISKEYKEIDNAYEKAKTLISLYKEGILHTAEASELFLDEDDIEITDIENINFGEGSIGVSFEFHPSSSYVELIRDDLIDDVNNGEPPVTYDGDELSEDDIMNLDDDEVVDFASDRASFPSSDYSDIPEASLRL